MNDDYYEYIMCSSTTGAEKILAEDKKLPERKEDLGIDEKNYAPLRATRRLVGYVKEQDR